VQIVTIWLLHDNVAFVIFIFMFTITVECFMERWHYKSTLSCDIVLQCLARISGEVCWSHCSFLALSLSVTKFHVVDIYHTIWLHGAALQYHNTINIEYCWLNCTSSYALLKVVITTQHYIKLNIALPKKTLNVKNMYKQLQWAEYTSACAMNL